jgi:eight-cysteine-cluster-containing protein
MRVLTLVTVLAITLAGCKSSGEKPVTEPPPDTGVVIGEPPAPANRTPAVKADHALYARVEGTNFKNACTKDQECMKGGCSAEVCAAEEVNSTCEMPADGFPQGASALCGCVKSDCIWYTETTTGAASGGAKQGQPAQ